MKNKNIEKYKDLDERFFATNCPFDYVFEYKNKEYIIKFDWDNRKGYFFAFGKEQPKLYKTIYEALDKIKFDDKSLREMLLNTDFTFLEVL